LAAKQAPAAINETANAITAIRVFIIRDSAGNAGQRQYLTADYAINDQSSI
jgi:hypothetical protein